MADYLLEIGTEELPANRVSDAQERLKTALGDELEAASLSYKEIKTFGTPRRLAAIVSGLDAMQPTIEKKVKGPPVKSSFDASGKALPPAQGFAAKQGLKVEDLAQEEIAGVNYLIANVTVHGKPTAEVITQIIPGIIEQLSGERPMRWGSSDFKFSRPIRWLVSLLDNDVVPFNTAGLTAGRNSYGHRILCPGTIEIKNAGSYLQQLKEKKVLASPEERKKEITAQVIAKTQELKGEPRQLKGSLLDEVVNITEWPTAVVGGFATEYLDLPDTLIETVMVHHQRYFPVQQTTDKSKLLPNFVSIANTDLKEAEKQIRAGNERVLVARLADARFFYFDDQRIKLSDHVKDLANLTFHEGIGSYSDKQQRLMDAARMLADSLKLNAEQKICLERTMELCKLDLVTNLVRELPELQGYVGSWYATKQNEPQQVVAAIASHYAPRSTDDPIPGDEVGRFAAVIDKLDSLVGVFMLGKRATGSSDPFMLRRLAQGLIDILDGLSATSHRINVTMLIEWLKAQYYPYLEQRPGKDVKKDSVGSETKAEKDIADLREFILQRLRTKLLDKGFKRETIEAVLSSGDPLADVTDVIERLTCLEELMSENGGLDIVRTGVRVGNILAPDSPEKVNEGLFGEDSEKQLWQSFNTEVVATWGNGQPRKPSNKEEYKQLLKLLAKISKPVDRLFEEVMVNDPDKTKRDNRHAILKNVDKYFKTVADFPKLQSLLPVLLFLLMSFALNMPIAQAAIPQPKVKVPPMVKEESVSTFVPSEAAPGKGLAVNIIYPQKARYPEGCPVVVVVPGGMRSDGLTVTTHSAQSGFCEVRFAFPGGGTERFGSTGVYDSRGPVCQMALRDVILFAAGKLEDYQGRRIHHLLPVEVSTNNLGLIGWTNGGNIALATMSKYDKELSFIKWATFFESPVGPMFFPPNLGGAHDQFLNRHYRQGSSATGQCLIDWRKIAFQPGVQKYPGEHGKASEPEVPGVVFFDENKNGIWDETHEYALTYATDGDVQKQFYPPEVVSALKRFKVDMKDWKTVASQEESENYFNERDGSLYINDICQAYPNLMVTIVGTQIDNLQRQPDHPHIGFLYNAFLTKKIRFLRLNPDPHYVAKIAAMNVGNFVDNKIAAPLDATSMDPHMEPEGIVPDYVYTEAAISELADRRRANNFSELTQVLDSYASAAAPETTPAKAAPKQAPAIPVSKITPILKEEEPQLDDLFSDQ